MAKPTDAQILATLVREGHLPAAEVAALCEEARADGVALLTFLVRRGRVNAATAVRVVASTRRRAAPAHRPRLGAYVLEEELGRGTMGAVYRATHAETSQPVAIKVLSRSDDRARQRFVREAQVLAQLKHPAIPRVHAILEDLPAPAIVMELVTGQRFTERLADAGVPLEDHLRKLLDVAQALHYVHEAGIVHRDVKPDNLMITEQGVKVLDFGLAHDNDDERLTQTGWVLGTPRYMSPEQLQGARASRAFDIWAVGTLILQAASGHHPWELDYAALETADEKALPPALLAIVQRATALDASARYATALQLADDLEDYLDGDPRRSRSPGVIIITTSALAVVLAGSLAIAWPSGDVQDLPQPDDPAAVTSEADADVATADPAEPADLDPPGASPLVRAGLVQHRAQRYAEAAAEFLRATEENPQDALAWLYLGESTRLRGAEHQERALECYENALTLRDDLWRAHFGRACIAVSRGDYEGGLVLLGQTIERAPEEALVAYLDRSSVLISLKRFTEARQDVDALIALAPEHRAQLLINRATINLEEKRFAACEQDAREGLRLGGPQGLGYSVIGNLRLRQERIAEALRAYDKAIELDPEVPHAYSGRSAVHMRRGDYAAAIADVDAALAKADAQTKDRLGLLDGIATMGAKFSPFNRAEVLATKGTALWNLGRNEEARVAFDAGLDLWEVDRLYIGRGNLNNTERRYSEALRDFNAAARLTPDDSMVYANRGSLYRVLGQRDAARRDLDRAVANDPQNEVARINRGNLLMELELFDLAERDLHEAVRITGGADSLAHNSVGVLRMRQKRHDEALAAFEESLRVDPTDADVWKNKGVALDRLQRYGEALDSFITARRLGLQLENLNAVIEDLRKKSGRQ